jgi:catechol 2,3-dioxygenase-like lactoylglutathione lyase family enzyme
MMQRPSLRIDTVEIPTADLARATNWYQAALGLTCTWSDENHALLSGGGPDAAHEDSFGVRLLLVETEDTTRHGFTNSTNGLNHSVIDLQTPQLDEFHAFLRAQGTRTDELQPPVNAWAPRGFGFFDSEGNRLAAYTYAKAGKA